MPRICVAYTCVSQGPISDHYAARFVSTWHEFPPGVETDLVVICNGGPLNTRLSMVFAPICPTFFPRTNKDWDIGGYHEAAWGPCAGYESMLCIGESVYFHKEGWLKRLDDAWKSIGPGMYGPFASNLLRPHLNTTAFFTSPLLLQRDPLNTSDRYAWEHGDHSFWKHVARNGMPVRLVTWDGEWEPRAWRVPRNILWRGNQSNCLMWCNHTDRYSESPPAVRSKWASGADRPYK